MNELEVKEDFTDIYTQNSPYRYLREMNRLEYTIADSTKPLYTAIIEELQSKLSRPINILDLGSSYGINSALIKHNLTMSKLNDFFLNGTEPTKNETKQFYEEHTINDNMNFYQIDISEEALKFSEDMGLCEKSINIDLETEKLDLQKSLPNIDLVVATGCIGYIGYKAFSNLLEGIKNRQSNPTKSEDHIDPIFAFTVLRMFDMRDIKETFENNNYSLVKSDLKPIHQRKFATPEEERETISILHDRGIDTKEYEDSGNFYADYYIARSKNQNQY